jgi:hypothetical protein
VTGPPEQRGTDADPAEDAGADTAEHGSDEEIDEASDESFPASDAPQWWSGGPDEQDR